MKRAFSGKLFLEGLKQLRVCGFISLALMEVVTFVSALNTLSVYRHDSQIVNVGFLKFNPSLLLLFTAAIPLMMLFLFSFLNKRSTSDFYHSLPQKRTVVFFSFFAAVLVWGLAILLVTELTALIFYLSVGDPFSLDILNILLGDLAVLSASLLVAASIGISMAVTGTAFTNIAVSLMLIFIPRVVMTMVVSSIDSFVPIVLNHDVLPPLGEQYNTVISLLLSFLDQGSAPFLPGILYTFAVGLVYTGIAAFLFTRRKSETAGQSAPNRFLQGVFRTVVALAFCLVPCWEIISWLMGESSPEILDIISFYLFAVLAFFVYELISTRKPKNLIRIIPSLGIVVLLNAAIIGGAVGICRYNLQIAPSAEQISSVSVLNEAGGYLEYKSAEVKLTDPIIKQVVADALRENVEQLKNENISHFYSANKDKEAWSFVIRKGSSTLYRRILLDEQQVKTVSDYLNKTDAYKNVFMKLPKPQGGIKPTNYTVFVRGETIDVSSVYDTLQAEINDMGYKNWAMYCTGAVYEVNNLQEGLSISTYCGANLCEWHITLSDMLPKTSNAVMKLINAEQDIEGLADLVQEKLQDNSLYSSLEVVYIAGNGRIDGDCYCWYTDYDQNGKGEKEKFDKMVAAIRANANKDPDIAKGVFRIDLGYEEEAGNRFEYHTRIVYLSAEDIALDEIFSETDAEMQEFDPKYVDKIVYN